MNQLLSMKLFTFLLLFLLSNANNSINLPFLNDLRTIDGVVLSDGQVEANHSHRRLSQSLYDYYSEVPETCPPKTSCPVICVYDEPYCPTKCPKGYQLCVDGSCSLEACSPDLWSPCLCDALYFACPRVIDYLDACEIRFEPEYDNNTLCIEEQDDATPKVSFTSFWFLFCYSWISGVTILFVGFCCYNQKLNPIRESEQSLHPVSAGEDEIQQEWIQIGYKKNLVGTIICFLIYITLWGIQFLLFFLTICYYMQQGSITRWQAVFEDDVQALTAFIIVWCVGFVFSFSFHWPESIAILFLRRCTLNKATHVAVIAPIMQIQSISNGRMKWGDVLVRTIWTPFDKIFRILFSYPPACDNYETLYCPVDHESKSFYHRMGRYIFSDDEDKFIPASLKIGNTIGDLLKWQQGLSFKQVMLHKTRVGPNIISVAKPNWFRVVYNEFSKSFYLYQTFILWTWFNYWYFQMALIGTITRVIGGLTVASFQHDSDCQLYKLSHVDGECEVIRDDTIFNVHVSDLVPGDVVILKPGLVCCDMIILESEHLMVDESAFTGESNPIAKESMTTLSHDHVYDEVDDKLYSIYAGSNILEVGDNEKERALVISTGSSTRKGQLLSDILSYRRIKFQFDDEINLVLLILLMEAIVLITLVFNFLQGQAVHAWFYGMFVLATIYPPLLVTVFVVSVGVSAKRLLKKNITCTNSEALLVAGKVNCCCFDKTGTLTEASMTNIKIDTLGDEELKNRADVRNNVGILDNGEIIINEVDKAKFQSSQSELTKIADLGMAVCHNVRILESGELTGNEVDKAIFQSSQAVLSYHKGEDMEVLHNEENYIIKKQFVFDHHRTTQSVIIEAVDGKKLVYVKGSAEGVRALCRPDSVPSSFDDAVRAYSKSGKYVIALACKEFIFDKDDYSLISRDDVETPFSFTFCGLITMENSLKNETCLVMDDLRQGNILLTMITGDNVHTGIKVAKEAGISKAQDFLLCQLSKEKCIEWVHAESDTFVAQPYEMFENLSIAITGEAWQALIDEDVNYAISIAKYIRVFGRCNPADKVSVVTTLVRLGCITLMCGDGQNDCGALKSAHVGIALSTSDASIVAPFTSLDLNLTAVTEVLREGRCALSSAFKVYTYFMMYGQVCSILQVINAYNFASFGDWPWIFIDAIWPLCLSFTLPLAKAAKKLSPRRPTASLFGVRTLSSVCGMLFLNILFITLSLKMLFQQDWFQCRMNTNTSVGGEYDLGDNYETSVIFVVGGFQFIASAIALNFGYSWRAVWYTNYWFILLAALFAVFQLVMILYPSEFSCIWRVNCANENVVLGFGTTYLMWINNPYNTTVMPSDFRWKLAGMVIVNLICLCAWEYFFVNDFLYRKYSFGKDESLQYSVALDGTDGKHMFDKKHEYDSPRYEADQKRYLLLESSASESASETSSGSPQDEK